MKGPLMDTVATSRGRTRTFLMSMTLGEENRRPCHSLATAITVAMVETPPAAAAAGTAV